MPLNLPAFRLFLSSLLKNPSPLVPYIQSESLLDVPIPFSGAKTLVQLNKTTTKAVILDKDCTFTLPGELDTTSAYVAKMEDIKKHYSVLIVSNTAGAIAGDETSERLAREVEKKYGIPVLRQNPGALKPLCGIQAFRWFKDRGLVTLPREIVVIGDRTSTDILMGTYMGAFTWLLKGYRKEDGSLARGPLNKVEWEVNNYLLRNSRGPVTPPE